MSLRLAHSRLVIVTWTATQGREYAHEEVGRVCTTCPGRPAYSTDCAAAEHSFHREIKTDVEDLAPGETKRVSQLYQEMRSAVGVYAYHCGGPVYLVSAEKAPQLDSAIAELRAKFDAANAAFAVCRVGFFIKNVEINPDATDEETLRSIRNDVDAAVNRIITAVNSGNIGEIRAALRETKNVAGLLDGEAKGHATKLANFAGAVARRLKEAAKVGSEEVAKVVAQSKTSAARFGAIFDQVLGADQGSEAA